MASGYKQKNSSLPAAETEVRRGIDADPRSPAAVRARRGPDLRLMPAAIATWLSVGSTISTRSMWPMILTALILAIGWHQRRRMFGLLIAASVALLAAIGAYLQVVLIDREMAQLPTTITGNFRVTDSPTPTRNGGTKLAVAVPGIGATEVFLSDSASLPTENLLPGSVIALRGTVRFTEDHQLVPVQLNSNDAPQLISSPRGMWRVTGYIRDRLHAATARLPAHAAQLIPGMTLGDTSRIPAATAQNFRVTGLSHLVAVSGANVAIIVSAVVIAATACRVGRRVRYLIAAGAVLAFAVVVGPDPSILRASFMGMVGVVAVISARWSDSLAALFAAIILLLYVAPSLAVSYGFALSVAATAGIIAAAPVLRRRLLTRWQRVSRHRWNRDPTQAEAMLFSAMSVAIVADLVTAPLLVHMVGIVSPVGIVSNLAVTIAVAPITVLGLVSALISCIPGVGLPLGAAVLWLVSPCTWWIDTVARLGSGAWVLHTPPGWFWAVLWGAMMLPLCICPALARRTLVAGAVGCAFCLGWGVLRIGPYFPTDANPQIPTTHLTLPAGYLPAGDPWRIAVCAQPDGQWLVLVPKPQEQRCLHAPSTGAPVTRLPPGETPAAAVAARVAVVADDAHALQESARRATQPHTQPALELIVVQPGGSGGRGHGRMSMTPEGIAVAYPGREGASVLRGSEMLLSFPLGNPAAPNRGVGGLAR